MNTLVMIISAAVCCGIGLSAAPWLQRFAERPSRWLDRRLLGLLAAVGGAGAARLATSWPELITFTVLSVGLAALFVVDLASLRLPDRIVGPLYGAVLIGLATSAMISGAWHRLLVSLAAGAALLVCYFVLGLLGNGRLGLGDVKLSGLLGITLGWLGRPEFVLGALGGFSLGAVVSITLLVSWTEGRRASYPFGPCMIIGAALGAAFGPTALPLLAS